MLPMKAQVSLLALAVSACLTAGCTTTAAEPAAVATAAAEAPQPTAAAPTAAEADAFVARAERELSQFNPLLNRAQWANETNITPDTEALAAHFGTINTEMQVRLANEAARFANVPGLS